MNKVFMKNKFVKEFRLHNETRRVCQIMPAKLWQTHHILSTIDAIYWEREFSTRQIKSFLNSSNCWKIIQPFQKAHIILIIYEKQRKINTFFFWMKSSITSYISFIPKCRYQFGFGSVSKMQFLSNNIYIKKKHYSIWNR